MVHKSPQQEVDEYVELVAAVTDWLGIRVEQYPAWTVAALERELALLNKHNGWANVRLRDRAHVEHRIARAVEIDRGVIDEILIAHQLARRGRGPVQLGATPDAQLAGPPRGPLPLGHWKGTGFMPLTRGEAVGYDADLMAFQFTMRNGEQIVQCQISNAALGDLAGRWRGAARDLPTEFEAHRELIEAIASEQFDQTSNEETRLVRIFSKHMPYSTALK